MTVDPQADAAFRAWISRELRKAGPLTQQQQEDLRRLLRPRKTA